MISSTSQIVTTPSLSGQEAALVEMLVAAIGRPFGIWSKAANEAAWSPVPYLEQPAQPEQSGLETLLGLAEQSTESVAQLSADGRVAVARRLGARSNAVITVHCDPGEADLVEQLIESVAAQHRASADSVELQEENHTFAMQLASDLEELSFLRSMVDRLSSSRVNEKLVDMTRGTLPVLNATVRARCLAFLSLDNPEDPYTARVAAIEGEQSIPFDTLSQIVRCYGPSATDGPLVKNWDCEDLPDEATLWSDGEQPPGVKSLILAPLTSGEEHLGWLAAINRKASGEIGLESSWQLASGEFGSGEGSLIATTASILATHAANRDLLREKEKLIVGVIRSLVSAIEAKDNYTRGHSERVALYTKRIAEQVGYDEADAEDLYLTGLLHDVGKIGVSDAVLKKEGRLTEEEFAEIARHPDEGWAILCMLEQLQYVLPGVLHHHERWDGRGYPDGLAGEAIPLDGRVMAVADAYDAMTSDRPYRSGMPSEKAESILREGAGSQWDPQCVDAFFACLDDIHRIKSTYKQRERPVRQRAATRDESIPLVNEVAGVIK